MARSCAPSCSPCSSCRWPKARALAAAILSKCTGQHGRCCLQLLLQESPCSSSRLLRPPSLCVVFPLLWPVLSCLPGLPVGGRGECYRAPRPRPTGLGQVWATPHLGWGMFFYCVFIHSWSFFPLAIAFLGFLLLLINTREPAVPGCSGTAMPVGGFFRAGRKAGSSGPSEVPCTSSSNLPWLVTHHCETCDPVTPHPEGGTWVSGPPSSSQTSSLSNPGPHSCRLVTQHWRARVAEPAEARRAGCRQVPCSPLLVSGWKSQDRRMLCSLTQLDLGLADLIPESRYFR